MYFGTLWCWARAKKVCFLGWGDLHNWNEMNCFIEPNLSTLIKSNPFDGGRLTMKSMGHTSQCIFGIKRKYSVPTCFLKIVQFWTCMSRFCPASSTNNNSFAIMMYCIFYHHVLQVIHCDIPSNICIITYPSKHTTNFVCNKTILLATRSVTWFHFTSRPSLGSLGPTGQASWTKVPLNASPYLIFMFKKLLNIFKKVHLNKVCYSHFCPKDLWYM
jgi:hypothetical protein